MSNNTADLEGKELASYAEAQYPDSKMNFKIEGTAVAPAVELASFRQNRNQTRSLEDYGGFNWMLDANRRSVLRNLELAREGHYDWRNNEEDRQELANKLIAFSQPQAPAAEIAGYRQFVINSDLLAIPFALGFFQSINLSADEIIQIITPKARQYFNVRSMGQDGGARQDQWRTARTAQEQEMNLVATDKIEYPLLDLQQGDVNEFDTINAQLRFDMEMKIDADAKTNLDNGKVTSGLKALMNIHPKIDQTNIPDSNYLDLTSTGTYGTAHVLTLIRLKAILARMAQWGFGLDPDGPVQIKSMIQSPLNARDSWDYVNLVSGFNNSGGEVNPQNTVPTAVRERIYAGGSMINSAWGYTWANQYNTQLPAGRLYVMTNQPVGWWLTKTSFDRMIEWKDAPDNIEQNLAQVMYRKAYRFFMPSLWAYRYLIVDF